MAVDSYMTLSQLQERIRETLCRGFAAPVWITAEIGELKVNARSGHCYLQLVEKGGRNGVPQAQVQAVIWAGQYGMLSSYFRGATGEELAVGMKVLLHVTVTYHELYGLSLRIVDIDPLYTLGDLARQRMQTIAQLREDGVFDLNRELGIPEVPQRIAVVSSPQAAGYQDFMKELGASPYRFDVTLFGAVMQGHGAETSIIGALDAVADRAEEFDAAVIIRGGGSQSDLSFLNSYLLSFHIAQFPLPVILDREGKDVQMCGALLRERVSGARLRMEWRLRTLADGLAAGARRVLQMKGLRLDELRERLEEGAGRAVASGEARLLQARQLVSAADPCNILARGFAVVRTAGRALTDAADAVPGENLDITLYKGRVTAKVTDNYGKE